MFHKHSRNCWAVATSLEEFVIEHSEALTVISKNPLFQKDVYEKKRCDRSETIFCTIKNHYEAHKKDVDAITLLDADGIVTLSFGVVSIIPKYGTKPYDLISV